MNVERLSTSEKYSTTVALLFRPVSSGKIVWFRIVLGLTVAAQVLLWLVSGDYRRDYVDKPFHFAFPGLIQLPELPDGLMYGLAGVLFLSGLMIAVGLQYRVAATVAAVLFGYLFLLDLSLYQNHFYLLSLLLALSPIVPAASTFSVDRLNKVNTGPTRYWHLLLIQFHLALPYVFGAIAKLSADWLHGEPMRQVLSRYHDHPVIGTFATEEWFVQLFVWGGIFVDLLIVPGLMWKRTRWITVAAASSFHLTNAGLFGIGVFPWMMLMMLPVFFDVPPNQHEHGEKSASRSSAGKGPDNFISLFSCSHAISSSFARWQCELDGTRSLLRMAHEVKT